MCFNGLQYLYPRKRILKNPSKTSTGAIKIKVSQKESMPKKTKKHATKCLQYVFRHSVSKTSINLPQPPSKMPPPPPQDPPRWAQDGAKILPRGPKTTPKRPNMLPRRSLDAPKSSLTCLINFKVVQKPCPRGSKTPKTPPGPHPGHVFGGRFGWLFLLKMAPDHP